MFIRADESCVTRSRNAGVHDSHLLYILDPLITFLLGLLAWPLGRMQCRSQWDGRGTAVRWHNRAPRT